MVPCLLQHTRLDYRIRSEGKPEVCTPGKTGKPSRRYADDFESFAVQQDLPADCSWVTPQPRAPECV